MANAWYCMHVAHSDFFINMHLLDSPCAAVQDDVVTRRPVPLTPDIFSVPCILKRHNVCRINIRFEHFAPTGCPLQPGPAQWQKGLTSTAYTEWLIIPVLCRCQWTKAMDYSSLFPHTFVFIAKRSKRNISMLFYATLRFPICIFMLCLKDFSSLSVKGKGWASNNFYMWYLFSSIEVKCIYFAIFYPRFTHAFTREAPVCHALL